MLSKSVLCHIYVAGMQFAVLYCSIIFATFKFRIHTYIVCGKHFGLQTIRFCYFTKKYFHQNYAVQSFYKIMFITRMTSDGPSPVRKSLQVKYQMIYAINRAVRNRDEKNHPLKKTPLMILLLWNRGKWKIFFTPTQFCLHGPIDRVDHLILQHLKKNMNRCFHQL